MFPIKSVTSGLNLQVTKDSRSLQQIVQYFFRVEFKEALWKNSIRASILKDIGFSIIWRKILEQIVEKLML